MSAAGTHPLHIGNVFMGADHGAPVPSDRCWPRQHSEDIGFQLGSPVGECVVLADDVFSQDQIGVPQRFRGLLQRMSRQTAEFSGVGAQRSQPLLKYSSHGHRAYGEKLGFTHVDMGIWEISVN
ncbi:hypothetical protein ABIA30_005206 [Mycobacterium sp. MAA66]